jgi:glutamate carboxypeptidase
MKEISVNADPIKEFIARHHNEIFERLKIMVNIDSYSHDREGVNRIGTKMKEFLDGFGIPHVTRPQDKYGDHIIATLKGNKPGKILLMGHMDTVFPPGEVLKRPFTEDDTYVYGPGVSDMQAGLISILYATAAIKQSGIDMCDMEILFTPDEEIGSPSSRSIIEERAKDAMAVFNLEPGRPDGSVVTSRKGSAHLKFHIQGKAAHSGLFIEQGISAIEELGYKIVELRKLMDLERGITINVGLVSGGVNTNVVAPEATGTIHFGFWTVKDYEETMERIRNIIHTSYVAGTKNTLSGSLSFLPMERHEGVDQMFEMVKAVAATLNIELTELAAKGASDAGFTASLGKPTICGMGPVGGKWHNLDEYMIKDTCIPRIQLLAISIVAAFHRFSK